MKFSENWLRTLVPTTTDSAGLQAALTAIGLEVEDAQVLGKGLEHVVVAEIRACARHPEADRLQVCEVDAGPHGVLQIVCGAPNARAGLKAPLAMVGAQLGEIKIKPAKLRGVDSNGMLCSAKELGLDADASGLLELPADAPVGTAIADYLQLPDTSIELKLTPNRADCFSLTGIAHDVAAATGSHVVPVQVEAVPAQSDAALELNVQTGADAPCYMGRVIEGVDAAVATPVWMAERLRRSGIRPLSFLVDVTQYVMLELGQPMHAFDRDTLSGPVGVRHARAGETLKLLDGRAVTLDDGFLVITDAEAAVALAGIMGGESTRVTTATRNVFLEAAHFAPAAIMGRARKLGLHTDASHRFERGVDPHLPRRAIERATCLILQVAGGTPGPVTEHLDAHHLPAPQPVPLRRARLARVLGMTVEDVQVERILNALGFAVTPNAEGWLATPPSSRFDISIEEDLIEEIARIHGYDAIPVALPQAGGRLQAPSETARTPDALRAMLVAHGWLEAITFAFQPEALLKTWGLEENAIALANPLSAELAVMRPSVLPGLAAAAAYNAARQATRLKLFEIGNVFHAGAGNAPLQTLRLAGIAFGPASLEHPFEVTRNNDVHDLQGLVSLIAASTGAQLEWRTATCPFAHPGRCAESWLNGECIGWLGELHPALCTALDLPARTCAFELDAKPLLAAKVPAAHPPGRFPSVRRDLALVLPRNTEWASVEAVVRNAAGPTLREVHPFDLYTGKGMAEHEKSLALGLILQDESRTLTDQDVSEVIARVIADTASQLGATVRG